LLLLLLLSIPPCCFHNVHLLCPFSCDLSWLVFLCHPWQQRNAQEMHLSLSLSLQHPSPTTLSLPRRICLPLLSTDDKTKRDKRESSREKIVAILFVVLQNRLCRTDASVPKARTRRSPCRTQLSRDWICLLLLAYLRS
jgi:hypothetical protein